MYSEEDKGNAVDWGIISASKWLTIQWRNHNKRRNTEPMVKIRVNVESAIVNRGGRGCFFSEEIPNRPDTCIWYLYLIPLPTFSTA